MKGDIMQIVVAVVLITTVAQSSSDGDVDVEEQSLANQSLIQFDPASTCKELVDQIRHFKTQTLHRIFEKPKYVPKKLILAIKKSEKNLRKLMNKGACVTQAMKSLADDRLSTTYSIFKHEMRNEAKARLNLQIAQLQSLEPVIQGALQPMIDALIAIDLDAEAITICERPGETRIRIKPGQCIHENTCAGLDSTCAGNKQLQVCACRQETDFRAPDHHGCGSVQMCVDLHAKNETKIECGKQLIAPSTNLLTRIVGGEYTVPHSWPWQARVGRFCGAAIISEDILITAAHCIASVQVGITTVVVGEHDLRSNNPSVQELPIDTVVVHPSYNDVLIENDIALIKLAAPIKLGVTKTPICVPDQMAPAGTVCYVTGWGRMRQLSSRQSNILKQAYNPVAANETCERFFPNELDYHSMFCAYSTGHDACQGDSGGPLSCYVDGRWELQGIVSWGFGCGIAPGIYTRVASYTEWISETVNNVKTQ